MNDSMTPYFLIKHMQQPYRKTSSTFLKKTKQTILKLSFPIQSNVIARSQLYTLYNKYEGDPN